MNISLGKSTKFPIPASFSSTIKTFSEGLSYSSRFSLEIGLGRLVIFKGSFLHFTSYHIPMKIRELSSLRPCIYLFAFSGLCKSF